MKGNNNNPMNNKMNLVQKHGNNNIQMNNIIQSNTLPPGYQTTIGDTPTFHEPHTAYETNIRPLDSSTSTTFIGGSTVYVAQDQVMSIPVYLKVDKKSYIIGNTITRGGFGEIYHIKVTPNSILPTNQPIIGKKMITSSDQSENSYIQELSMMTLFRGNEYFCQLVGYDDLEKFIFILFYPNGSCDSYQKKMTKLSLKRICSILIGTCHAITDMVFKNHLKL